MSDSDDHPLLTKRMGGALAVLAFSAGLGLALMSFQLFPIGMTISVLGAAGAIWIYWKDRRLLRLRLVGATGAARPLYIEIWVVLLALILAVGAPAYVCIRALIPSPPIDLSRHLTNEEKLRMRPKLTLSPNESFSIEFNSLPNCDECGNYAEEFRDFLNSIPGWKARGSTLVFSNPNMPRTGLQLALSNKASAEVAKKLTSAFSAANILWFGLPTEGAMPDLDAIVVVARRPK
jgi:hypothetical protein